MTPIEVLFTKRKSEQLRIVGILDEVFAGLEAMRANAEKNLQNASAVYNSYLNGIFTRHGAGWLENHLETIAEIINGYAFKSPDVSAKNGVRCITITNVGVRYFNIESKEYLPNSYAAAYSPVSVKKGAIVIALTRSIISGGLKVAVVPPLYDGALLNQRVACINVKPNFITQPFLFAFLSTRAAADYVKKRVNTLRARLEFQI